MDEYSWIQVRVLLMQAQFAWQFQAVLWFIPIWLDQPWSLGVLDATNWSTLTSNLGLAYDQPKWTCPFQLTEIAPYFFWGAVMQTWLIHSWPGCKLSLQWCNFSGSHGWRRKQGPCRSPKRPKSQVGGFLSHGGAPNHPRLKHFSEPHGCGGLPFYETPWWMVLSKLY